MRDESDMDDDVPGSIGGAGMGPSAGTPLGMERKEVRKSANAVADAKMDEALRRMQEVEGMLELKREKSLGLQGERARLETDIARTEERVAEKLKKWKGDA